MRRETVQPALFIEVQFKTIGCHDIRVAGAIGRAEIDPEAQILGRLCGPGELVVGLAPGPIVERGDRQGGSDAVADEAGKGTEYDIVFNTL